MDRRLKTKIKMIVCFSLLIGNTSCGHETISEQNRDDRVIPVMTDEKTVSEYVFITNLGHDAKGCPGCILNHGKYIHINCQGRGNACRAAATVSLNQVGTTITATTVDTFGLTNLDFFLMPDRSLEYLDENNNLIFLNIPAQQVYRDSTTLQFTFTGLYITSSPAYSND
jgi:hypothetical protein